MIKKGKAVSRNLVIRPGTKTLITTKFSKVKTQTRQDALMIKMETTVKLPS